VSLNLEHWIQYPKIDVHCHAGRDNAGDRLVATADDLGVWELWSSQPIVGGRIASMDEIRTRNDTTLAAMKRHPTRIQGMCFVIPGYYQRGSGGGGAVPGCWHDRGQALQPVPDL
jgi:hypothetical protein